MHRLCLDLGGRRILDEINLTLARGEFLGLIGPNGGGKTSVLRVLLGVLHPTRGTVQWLPRPDGTAPRIGYVPQRTELDRHYPLSCREIILQGVSGRGFLWGQRRRQALLLAEEWIGRFHLRPHAGTLAAELSGGQQRRMLLARALMSEPNVILLDEPTAGVDSAGQGEFCALLDELCRQGMTVVLVSHDIPLVMEHAHRIACLAVSLHWHGVAEALSADIIRHAYACELDRYQTGHHHSERVAKNREDSPQPRSALGKESSRHG